MESLGSLLLILLFLALGVLAGRSRLFREGNTTTFLLDFCLYALLFSMGLRIGENEAIRSQIARVGLIAVSCAVVTVVGTAVFVAAALAIGGRSKRAKRADPRRREAATESAQTREEEDREPRKKLAMVHLKDPLRLFAAVVVGFLVGFFVPPVSETVVAHATTVLLYLLVFLIGFQLSRSGVDLKKALVQPRTLVVPAAAVVGTLVGALALVPLFSLPVGKALSVAAGFGWYSLSGVLITNLGDPVLGSAAFIANMLREGISLLLIPLLGKVWLGEVAVGIAGATSMDVTLPLIGRSCGTSFVPLAVANGAILSFLVPILVPLLYRL